MIVSQEILDWLVTALRNNPAIALFLAVAIGYPVGTLSYRGLSIGTVAATLIAGLIVGQFDIQISSNVATVFFLLFLFAIGYRVGPQFVRGVAQDGAPQALFAVIVCAMMLGTAYGVARLAGYDVGYGAGLFSGAATSSAALGLSTSAIQGLGLSPDAARAMVGSLSTAFAMTYIFGTIGPILILSQLGPRLLRIDLPAACRAYEKRMGGTGNSSGSAWHHYIMRTYRLLDDSPQVGKRVDEVETMGSPGRCFLDQIRRGEQLLAAHEGTVLKAGDIVSVAGTRSTLRRMFAAGAEEVEDREMLAIPLGGVDIVVTRRAFDGKTLAELAQMEPTHGIFLTRIRRGAMGDDIPILPQTTVHRGDVLTVVGRPQRIRASTGAIGRADFSREETDVPAMFMMIVVGALIGVPVLTLGGVPLTLSIAGGVLLAGIASGWLRSVHPTFGNVPNPVVWFMNAVGLNLFIAVIGINAGPSFVSGVRDVGMSLFLWGMLVTSLPLILAMVLGKYVFRFDDAVVLGCCAGASASTAALGLLTDQAKSQVPTLGYTIPYAVSNTLLTIGGILIVSLL
ncbi:aspartate-alanine antiporter [Kaistia geumhonensis]|uniref:Transport protein n=1 Tax=Kaistia geumhonensis TaxID=410839 RepID=A0ABU0M103_9HYPH|nr:aspartate-alanine antiporter [Kaistia geumhonensis]MCX5480140.1 aspartate-alanine antiporter [Kaistia geumhonensis]MDQ0514631.1 putative transport protein [Kaistia geumhonensis]